MDDDEIRDEIRQRDEAIAALEKQIERLKRERDMEAAVRWFDG
jgi:uncharacterized small protein (DUF1192 family)